MFPISEPDGTVELPPMATFWTPKRSEIGEEGFGYFRDVWPIFDASRRAAKEIITEEHALATVVGNLARDEEEFDRLATSVENGFQEPPEIRMSPEQRAKLSSIIEEPHLLDGLELGVAGLTYALASSGMYPAASCRGHTGTRPWSPAPVVYFAADQNHAEKLVPLVGQSGCQFVQDEFRSEFLIVQGRSILDTMRLGFLIVERSSRQWRSPRSRVERAKEPQQLLLF